MSDESAVIQRIKELCSEKGISITNLCLTITGSKGNLRTWNKGNIRTDYLLKIAEYFDVSVDYLLGKTDVRNPLDEHLDEIDYALSGEIRDLTDEEKEDVLMYIRFKKSQRKDHYKEE